MKELLSISGTAGLHRLITTKKNGIVAESLATGQKKFYAARSYQYSPLESIAVYTDTDALPLEEVFQKMKEQPPSEDIGKSGLRAYFMEILPDHDQEKVYTSDIKKIVSWFLFLNENGYLEAEEEAETSEEAEVDSSEEE